MKRFAVIGDPIVHSLSPALHQEVYSQLGLEASFEKIKVRPDSLHSFMDTQSLDGFNVTIPHKQSVISFLDKLDDAAQTIGAVNCVHNGKGYNTDWIGFLKAMDANEVNLLGKKCVILGAGGAARAIAYALIQSNVSFISIMNRTPEKAKQLTYWILQISDIKTVVLEHAATLTPEHIIINCTPLGMWPDTETIPEIEVQSSQVLVDTIYNPIKTKWLMAGESLGAKTVGGLDMFIAQGLASTDIWFGDKISEKVNISLIHDQLKKGLIQE